MAKTEKTMPAAQEVPIRDGDDDKAVDKLVAVFGQKGGTNG